MGLSTTTKFRKPHIEPKGALGVYFSGLTVKSAKRTLWKHMRTVTDCHFLMQVTVFCHVEAFLACIIVSPTTLTCQINHCSFIRCVDINVFMPI